MNWILFILFMALFFIFLLIGIFTTKKVYYFIAFLFMAIIGIYILGTGLEIPYGALIS